MSDEPKTLCTTNADLKCMDDILKSLTHLKRQFDDPDHQLSPEAFRSHLWQLTDMIFSRKSGFIEYTASKCLKSVLRREEVCKAVMKDYTDMLLHRLEHSSVDQPHHIFDILTSLLSLKLHKEFTDDLIIMITQKWQMCCCHVFRDLKQTCHLRTTIAFLSLWKKLYKRMTGSENRSHIPETYLEAQEKFICDFTDHFHTLSPICEYKFIDVVNMILTTSLNSSHNSLYSCRFAKYLLDKFSKNIKSILEHYRKVPSGFLGTAQNVCVAGDGENGHLKMLRKLSSLVINCCHVHCKWNGDYDAEALHLIAHILSEERGDPSTWVLQVFGEQDDQLIVVMHHLLSIFLMTFKQRGRDDVLAVDDTFPAAFNPHAVFLQFLAFINWDNSLLLDFVISPETDFLEYFVKYLKYLASDWNGFQLQCDYFANCEKYKTDNKGHVYNDISKKFSDTENTGSITKGDNMNKMDVENSRYVNPLKWNRVSCNIDMSHDDDTSMRSKSETTKCDITKSGANDIKNVGFISSNSPLNCSHDVEKSNSSQEFKYDDSLILKNPVLVEYSSSDDATDEENVGSDSSYSHTSFTVHQYDKDSLSKTLGVKEDCTLDKCMSVLCRTSLAIERMIEQNLLPFNATPLLNLLQKCEGLYENKST